MFSLRENTENVISLRLGGLVESADPSFVIQFKDELSLKVLAVDVQDVSAYPDRYQQFELTLPDDLPQLKAGDYLWTIYDESTGELVPLKSGLCKVCKVYK